MYMVLDMNFGEILQSCKENYQPFTAEVPVKRHPSSLVESIRRARGEGRRPVIAEIKPASPTAGAIRDIDDPADIARIYTANGACGISVLTERRFFGGSLRNLRAVAMASVPVLRKDFLFDTAQVRESYYYGADSLLLISSFFDEGALTMMIDESRRYGIEPLVEVHDEADIVRSAAAGAELYGINNRDRETLEVDRKRTAKLAPKIDGITVSASGINSVAELEEALRYCDAALIGTALMQADDPGKKLYELVYGDF